MGFKSGPGGDIGGSEVTTTGSGSFGVVQVAEQVNPAAPADGAGGILYSKSDGKLYWISNELAETDLTSGGSGISHDGSTANGILTFKDADEATVESKALVDGAKITIGNGTAEDTLLVFDGNAADFRIGIDDDSDTLEIGAGAAHDTTAAVIIDGSGHVTKIGQDSPTNGQFLKWDGSKAVWDAAGGSDTFVITDRGITSAAMSSGSYYYKGNMAGANWDNNVAAASWPMQLQFYYKFGNSAVLPVAADMTGYSLIGHKEGADSDTARFIVWKITAATDEAAETTVATATKIFHADVAGSGNTLFKETGTLSSGNSFAVGDAICITWTVAPGEGAVSSADHYFQVAFEFTPT